MAYCQMESCNKAEERRHNIRAQRKDYLHDRRIQTEIDRSKEDSCTYSKVIRSMSHPLFFDNPVIDDIITQLALRAFELICDTYGIDNIE